MNYTNELGAFSVDIPGEPTDISREMQNPVDADSEPYQMNIFSVNDVKENSFYLIRYNDMPNGYYLNNKYASFESIESNLEGKADLVTEPTVISLDGNEGREVEILMQGKYHAIIRVYIRGNRLYLIMEQKLNETDKTSTEDAFFKSFKFLDYAPSSTKTYKPEDDTFEVTFFDDVKSRIDSAGYTYSKIKNSVSYYSKNPSSGGLYQINFGQLQDYFKVKDPKEFYKEHIKLYQEWNDSIIEQKEIKVDGKDGMAFMIQQEGNSEVKRNQIWLENDRLFVMTGYLSSEEYQSAVADSIFNSFKNKATQVKTFDWYSSKSDQLLHDLHSKDSLTFQRALGAFNYYEFESSDLPKLYETLKATYSDTLYTNTIKESIIGVFNTVHDSITIQNLKGLYIASEDNDDLKSTIISTIPTIEEDNAMATYKELLAMSPPKTAESYNWTILSPFRDSLEFSIDNYKLLTSLNEYEPYRNSVLNISTRILEEHPEQKNVVLLAQNDLLKFAKQDLKAYTESLTDTIGNRYTYSTLMGAYLSFFNSTALNTSLSDDFTKQIIKLNDNQWYVTQAMIARLKSHHEVDKNTVNSLMDSLYHRFDIMKAYHDIKQFNKVPKKYKETEAFAKLSLFDYFNDEDYQLDGYDILGKISKNNQKYYVFKINFEDEAIPYLATVGPIKKLSEDEALQLYHIYTNWSLVEEGNWQEQAKTLILETSEQNNK